MGAAEVPSAGCRAGPLRDENGLSSREAYLGPVPHFRSRDLGTGMAKLKLLKARFVSLERSIALLHVYAKHGALPTQGRLELWWLW